MLRVVQRRVRPLTRRHASHVLHGVPRVLQRDHALVQQVGNLAKRASSQIKGVGGGGNGRLRGGPRPARRNVLEHFDRCDEENRVHRRVFVHV